MSDCHVVTRRNVRQGANDRVGEVGLSFVVGALELYSIVRDKLSLLLYTFSDRQSTDGAQQTVNHFLFRAQS